MIKFLNDIRNVEKPISNNRKIINTIAVLFLGIALGTSYVYIAVEQVTLVQWLLQSEHLLFDVARA